MNEARPVDGAVREIFEAQRRWFDEGHTLPRAFREERLRAFVSTVQQREKDIAEAVWADLHKPELEAYTTETSMIVNEAKHAIRSLKHWMRPHRFMSALVAQPARSAIVPSPLGVNLILGAWNYPVQLSLQPLVAAIAAGNTAVVKPSELSPASSAVVAQIIEQTFDPRHVAAVEGGVDTSTALLTMPWDHVFYTGGTQVGRIVAKAAAEHLSRVTLELGGKSPCLVMSSARLDSAAARIAWGKWMNAGQTCVAPDYVLVHESLRDDLIERLQQRVTAMYGADPRQSPDFGRIVNQRHFARVEAMIDPAKVAFGGQTDASERYVAPTVLKDVTLDDPVMRDEIFGPVLPVITIRSLDEALAIVRRHPNPLALYAFTEDRAEANAIVERVGFGGGCINNVVLHLSDAGLPFGGVGSSGTGAYHGKHGFDCFTHKKAVLDASSSRLLDLPLKYAPYEGKLEKLKWILG